MFLFFPIEAPSRIEAPPCSSMEKNMFPSYHLVTVTFCHRSEVINILCENFRVIEIS